MYALIQLPVIITAEPVSGHPLMQKLNRTNLCGQHKKPPYAGI